MPCLRIRSVTGTPASPSFRISTICDSVNLDFFIGSPVRRESTNACVRGRGAYEGTDLGSQWSCDLVQAARERQVSLARLRCLITGDLRAGADAAARRRGLHAHSPAADGACSGSIIG